MIYKTTPAIDHKATGAFWRIIRERYGFSLRDMAKRLEFSPAYLSDLEQGKRNWSIEKESQYIKMLKRV